MMRPMMILIVAGQSNAVGFDESRIPADYEAGFRRERLFQLGLYDEDNLRAVPLGACAQNFQDMRPYGHPDSAVPGTRGIHLPLADALLDHIPADYDILVLPCAYGGCAFTIGEDGTVDPQTLRPAPGKWRWGIGSAYYRAMCERLRFALDMDPRNRFLGMVWCQGEFDKQDAAGQWAGFEPMAEDFLTRFGAAYPGRVWKGDWNRDIWYNYETTWYWYGEGECARIWENYRRWSPATYIPVPRGTDTNETNGTGITTATYPAHFGNNAFAEVVAPLVAARMAERLDAE